MQYLRVLISSLCCLLMTANFSSGWTTELATSVLQTPCAPKADPTWQEIVHYARKYLPMEGQLMMKSDGFVYLKVDDEYIHTLFPMLGLEKEGFKKPPYFRTREAPGAHISVFYENEHIIPKEIGQYFCFNLKQIVIVKPSYQTSYAVLEVESPELEKLREKYGLKPKLLGHEYHISLAKKVASKKA